MAEDTQNFQTDTKMVVQFDKTRGLWNWRVISRGTTSIGGTLPKTVWGDGYTETIVSASKLAAYKMKEVVGSDAVGVGITFHTTDSGMIRVGVSSLGPTGFTGGRGQYLTAERFTKGS